MLCRDSIPSSLQATSEYRAPSSTFPSRRSGVGCTGLECIVRGSEFRVSRLEFRVRAPLVSKAFKLWGEPQDLLTSFCHGQTLR